MSKDHGAPGIATHGLSRRFGRVWAVRDVELKVPGGLITGFVGPNGAGKTTTLRMICGLIRPSSGEVSIGGKRLFYGPDSIPFRVRALVERPAFYESLTAFENLYLLARCTAGLTRNEVGEALKALGLTEAADRKVEGFSTGMLQRLGLAFCLLGKPQMIVLDEPTSGMDPEYRVTVRELLRSLRKTGDTTVIVSSHLLFEVQEVADHLILIRDGQVVLQGPLKELLGERSGSRYLLRAEPLELVRQALEKVPHRESGDGFSLELERDKVPDLVAGLVRQGARIYELREERASLEDLYLTTVGSKGVAVQ